MAQDSMKSTRSAVAAGIETPSYPKDHLPGEITTSMPPAVDGSAGMSRAKNALRNAYTAMTTIDLSKTQEGALERIKWVMDTVGPVTEVRAMSFRQSLTEPNSFSASPVRKDGIWSTFCDPQGDPSALSPDENTYTTFLARPS